MKPMQPCRVALLFLLVLAIAAGAEAQDSGLALGTGFSFGLECRPERLDQGIQDGYARVSPMASFMSAGLEARLGAFVEMESGGFPAMALGESYLRLYAGEGFMLEAGRYALHPGNALFLPCLDLFAQTDPLALIDPSAQTGLSDQLEARFLGGAFHLSLAWSPPFLAIGYEAPDSDGPYFPTAGMISDISYPALSIHATREGQSIGPSVDLSSREDGPGDFLANLGFSLGAVDAGLVFFSGLCREPAYLPRVVFGEDLYGGSFTIDLEPTFDRSDALGLYASASPEGGRAGAIELRLEGLYTWNKIIAQRLAGLPLPKMHEGIWSFSAGDIAYTDEVALTLGATWSAPSRPLSLFLEARAHLRPWEQEAIPDAAFSQLLLGGLRASFFDGRLDCVLVAASSLPHGGWAFATRLGLHSAGESSLTISMPFFLGEAESDFGQFGGKGSLSVIFEGQVR